MPNFAVTEFSEVRLLGILRTSPLGNSRKFISGILHSPGRVLEGGHEIGGCE
jgi:hypothetical protein